MTRGRVNIASRHSCDTLLVPFRFCGEHELKTHKRAQQHEGKAKPTFRFGLLFCLRVPRGREDLRVALLGGDERTLFGEQRLGEPPGTRVSFKCCLIVSCFGARKFGDDLLEGCDAIGAR